jgi:hypothetical protein
MAKLLADPMKGVRKAASIDATKIAFLESLSLPTDSEQLP